MDGKISMFGHYTPTQDKIDDEINNHYFDEVIDYHKTEPSFKRRLPTTFLIEQLMKIKKYPAGKAFLTVNFFLFFLCGIVMFFLTLSFKDSLVAAFFSVCIFFTSITIATAFFATNYTYDEPLQYLCLLLALLFYKYDKLLGFFIFFVVAIFTREASLLLLPGFALIFIQEKKWRWIVALIVSVAVYYLCQNYLLAPLFANENVTYQSTRFDLLKMNFETAGRSLESIVSAFMVVGLATYYFLIRKSDYKKMRVMFLVGLCINTIIILTLANASESRLFAMPLIFFWPLAGIWLRSIYAPTFNFTGKRVLYLLVLLSLVVASCSIIYLKYTTTYLPIEYHFNKQYVIATIIIIFLCELYRVGGKRGA